MNTSTMTYHGKKVYLGIDVHKKFYVFTAICGDEIVKKAKVEARPEKFAHQIRKWFKGAQIFSAYEAGFSGFRLHRELVKAGIKNIVVNPASIPVEANNKVKTDKRDSRNIATKLAIGELRPIYVPSEEEELERLLPRTREQLVKMKTKVGNQIKSKLHQFGLIDCFDDTVISQKFISNTLKLDLPFELKIAIEILAKHWTEINRSLSEMRALFKSQAAKKPEIERVYRSAPGVGDVSSRILATELGDMSRFVSNKKLYSFTGLTPSEFSSGEHIRRGHITRQGSSRIRHVLTEVAWRAIDQDIALRESFDRISKKAGKKKAIVAIARKIIGRLRACFINKQEYQLGIGRAELC